MSRLREERGLALVPAIGILFIVLLLGAAVLTTVNAQTSQSGAERSQEGSFQVAESALNTQLVQLSRNWPSSSTTAYPSCNQASPASSTCSGTDLTANFTNAGSDGPYAGSDFQTTPTWSTRVIDDVSGADYYSDSLADQGGVAAYDANGNGSVWVRSEAVVDGERSVLVSLVAQGAPRLEELPSASIVAGWFETTNNGKKVIVDAAGNSATAGVVAVRCDSGPGRGDPCLGYDPDKGQLNPADAYQTNYIDGTGTPNATNRRILDDEALERLKQRAQSLGTYYATGCPPSLSGELIYVENPTNANCSYTSNSNYNSSASPGVIIFGGGQLSIGGTSAYYGLIYNANRQGSAPSSGPCTAAFMNPVVNLNGATEIHGAILVDKCGGVIAGSNKVNVSFDANVFANVVSNGVAAGVKNTFRIVPST
jgi:Tfp pilus assembly protein PilX